jgi:hypothetical protein
MLNLGCSIPSAPHQGRASAQKHAYLTPNDATPDISLAYRFNGTLHKAFKNESFSEFEPFKKRVTQYVYPLIQSIAKIYPESQTESQADIHTILEGSLDAFLDECEQNAHKSKAMFKINLLAKDDAVFTHNILTSAEKMAQTPQAPNPLERRSAISPPLENERSYDPFSLVFIPSSGPALRWPGMIPQSNTSVTTHGPQTK